MPRKRYDVGMSSDDDFQPTRYNTQRKRRKLKRKSDRAAIHISRESRNIKPSKHKVTKNIQTISTSSGTSLEEKTMRVVLRRLDLKIGERYLINTTRDEKAEVNGHRKSTFTKLVISLPRAEHMNTFVSPSEPLIKQRRKRNLDGVIDSSDDENLLIKGKPVRKKIKEEMSLSFNDVFYLSSSEESESDASSDEDIFTSFTENDKPCRC